MDTRQPSRARRRTAMASLATATALIVGGLSVGLPTPAATAASKKKPDLVVTEARVVPASVPVGGRLRVTHTVRNKGKAKARTSASRFYLSTNVAASLEDRRKSRANPRTSPRDIRLVGSRSVPALQPGKKIEVTATVVTVPSSTRPRAYTVLVCSDDLGKLKESKEDQNCAPAKGTVRVVGPTPPPQEDDTELQTFAETSTWPEDEDFELQMIKLFCNATHPVRPVSLAAAITNVRNRLNADAAEGMRAFAGSSHASSAVAAQRLAAAAVTQDSPGLALAALLRAHQLEPRNGGHLINTASLAVSIGMPNEALAFLDAAQPLNLRRPAMGIPQTAIAMTVRGQALVMTGRLDAARGMFLAAKGAAPILSEADAGLATVEACQGDDDKAARFVRKSRQRTEKKIPPDEEPERPEPTIDISKGRPTPLRQLPMAETPRQGVVMEEEYHSIAHGFLSEIDAHNAEYDQLYQHLREVDELRPTPRAEQDRRDSILGLVYDAHEEPEVVALNDEVDELLEQLTLHKEEYWGGGTGEVPYIYAELSEAAWDACEGSDDADCYPKEMTETCRPEIIRGHVRWRTLMLQLQDAADAYMYAVSTRMSAYGANLEDEEAHRMAMLAIEGMERAVYALIVQQAQFWSTNLRIHEDYCVEPFEAEWSRVMAPPGRTHRAPAPPA